MPRLKPGRALPQIIVTGYPGLDQRHARDVLARVPGTVSRDPPPPATGDRQIGLTFESDQLFQAQLDFLSNASSQLIGKKLLDMGMSPSQVRWIKDKNVPIRSHKLFCPASDRLESVCHPGGLFKKGDVLFRHGKLLQASCTLPSALASSIQPGSAALVTYNRYGGALRTVSARVMTVRPFGAVLCSVTLAFTSALPDDPYRCHLKVLINAPDLAEDVDADAVSISQMAPAEPRVPIEYSPPYPRPRPVMIVDTHRDYIEDTRAAALFADPSSYFDADAERAMCASTLVMAFRHAPREIIASGRTAAHLMTVSQPALTIQTAAKRITRIRYAMHARGSFLIDGSAAALVRVCGTHVDDSIRSRWVQPLPRPSNDALESQPALKFGNQQADALRRIREWYSNGSKGVFKLFGYAGTGKTTIARELPEALGCRIAFVAYTGKAALVLRSKGCLDASTIHNALYLRIESFPGGPYQNIINYAGAIAKADLVVIDECSMVDRKLAQDLMSLGKPIIAMGDPMQLPPINGPGYFNRAKPDYFLEELHRQALDNPIIRMSVAARDGRTLRLGPYGDSQILKLDALPIERLMQANQVLAGRTKSCRSLTTTIRDLSGRMDPLPMCGDKLVCLRNNGKRGLLNGETWSTLSSKPSDGGTVTLEILSGTTGRKLNVKCLTEPFIGGNAELTPLEMSNAESFGYANVMTVHKSQGSEWDNVVLFDESEAFKEYPTRWLYTAITRASKRLTVIRT